MNFLFSARLPDGSELREDSVCWDQVPNGITFLHILRPDGEALVTIEGRSGRRIFLCNEGVAVKGERGMLSAKLFGLVDADQVVHEFRLDLITDSGVPQLTRRQYPLSDFEFGEGSFRTTS